MLVGRELGTAQAKKKAEQPRVSLYLPRGRSPTAFGQILTRAQAKVTRLDRGTLCLGSGEIRNETVQSWLRGAREKMPAVTDTVCSYRLQVAWMVGDQVEPGLTGRLQAWHPEAGGKAVTLIFPSRSPSLGMVVGRTSFLYPSHRVLTQKR